MYIFAAPKSPESSISFEQGPIRHPFRAKRPGTALYKINSTFVSCFGSSKVASQVDNSLNAQVSRFGSLPRSFRFDGILIQ